MINRIAIFALLVMTLTSCGGATQPPATTSTSADAPRTAQPPPPGIATVSGVVRFEGTAPKGTPIDMTIDQACCARNTGPVYPESLVVGPEKGLANVLVRVSKGLPQADWPIPAEPVVLDQNGCRYTPHVVAIRAGQTLRILNPDGTFHNVRTTSKLNKIVNFAMTAGQTEQKHVFENPGEAFSVHCDVHPWMEGWIHVLENPFYAVTDSAGRFALTGLPAGDYTIEAWHERLGVQTATVQVSDSVPATADFSFRAP